MSRFWGLYWAVAALLFLVNAIGLIVGVNAGEVRFDYEQDTPEARTEFYWTAWSLFVSTVANAVLWPLCAPSTIRMMVQAAQGHRFRMTFTRRPDPLRDADPEKAKRILGELSEWREGLNVPMGDPETVLAIMNAAAQEGRRAFNEWPKNLRRRCLASWFEAQIKGIDALDAEIQRQKQSTE